VKTTPFYGWYISGVCLLAHFMATGTSFYVFNAFMQPLATGKGWSYTQINVSLVIGPGVSLIASLVFGTLVVTWGPRVLMASGPIVSGLSFAMLGRVESLGGFYLFFTLLCLGNGAMNGLVAGTAVNNWFVRKRGTAMGIAGAGISLSGVVLPFVALLLLKRFGLERAYLLIGAVTLVMAPVAWLVIRDWPETYGLAPDGDPLGSAERDARHASVGTVRFVSPAPTGGSYPWNLGTLARTAAFWKVGIAYVLTLTGVAGTMSQLKPHFTTLGFDDWAAMLMMAATALMGTAGKFFWGALCDRIDPCRVVAALMACGAAGLAILWAGKSVPWLMLFIVVFGFAMGGVLSTLQIVNADLFGRRSFPTVGKYLALFIVLQGTGPLAMGTSMDLWGRYTPAFGLFIVLNGLAAMLMLSVTRPEPPPLACTAVGSAGRPRRR
jgi:MFS family permease